MRGLLPLNQLIQLSKSNGMESIALTDVNCLSGFINFVKHCNSMNVRLQQKKSQITTHKDKKKKISGGGLTIGKHTMNSWLTIQAMNILLNGEAELYGVDRALATMFGYHV